MDARPRDIDYAAKAVKVAIEEKFSRTAPLADLQVTANEQTITVADGVNRIEGTRDQLLAIIRKADSYGDVWRLFSSL